MDVVDVIVTDGFWRKSLSAVRSLGKAGFRVAVCGNSLLTTAFWSRYTWKKVTCVNASDDSESFGRQLLSVLESGIFNGTPVLLPMEDATLNWVSSNREKLAGLVDMLIPSVESLETAQSKAQTGAVAMEIGLPVPQSIVPDDVHEFEAVLGGLVNNCNESGYVIKPVTGSGSFGVIYLPTARETDWHAHWNKHGTLMIQERIPSAGRSIGVSLLYDRAGEYIAHFTHERLQQYPNSGGPSTARISIEDTELVAMSRRLLERLQWKGVAMVEWKIHPDTEKPYLLEINPRFWGSLELSIRSGVDFPSLYTRLASGADVSKVESYELGKLCRWLFPGEILRYLGQAEDERESIREFLRGLPGTAEEWNVSDIRGTLSSFFCPALLFLNPKYWKYLRH